MPPIEQPTPDNSTELEALILQGQENNASLKDIETIGEAGVMQQAKTTQAVEGLEPVLEAIAVNTVPKEVQKMQIVADEATDDEDALATTFYRMLRGKKGEKGDKGDKGDTGEALTWEMLTDEQKELIKGEKGEDGFTPVKGVDYFTEEEIDALVEVVKPKKGVDYFDGVDGEDGKDGKDGADGKDADEEKIIKEVLSKVKVKNGKDGKSVAVSDVLEALKASKAISYNDLADLPTFYRNGGGPGWLREISDVYLPTEPTNNYVLTWDATNKRWYAAEGGSGGSVTSVSVVSANGFAGTVATSTTTPAITLSTTVTGLLKGNGTAISAAVLGTDYGDVVGPASSTDNAITRFDGTTGKVIQNSTVTISDAGAIAGATSITLSGLTTGSVLFAGAAGAVSQDNTNFFWDDTNNRLGIGITSPSTTVNVLSTQSSGTAHPDRAGMIVEAAGTSVGGRIAARVFSSTEVPVFLGYRARNTKASPATLQSGDNLLQLSGVGYDGTAWGGGALASFVASETWDAASHGALITFSTTTNATTTTTERMRINHNGLVGIGETSPAARLHLDGTISATAWTTNGIGIRQDSTTYTDTSSSGTVSAMALNSFLGGTFAASSATTYTDSSTIRLVGPTAGTNVTFTNPKVIQTVFTSAGAETMAASFMNSSTTASTGVSLDLNPSTQGSGTRSAQIFAQNNGSNAIALGFRVSNGAAPAEWLRLVASGELVGSHTSILSVAGASNRGLQMYGTDAHAGATFGRFSNNNSAPSVAFLKSRGATVGSLGIITNGDELGRIEFAVDDGTDYASTAARIAVLSDGVPGVDDTPGKLVFYTTPDGSATPSARMTILESGYTGVGSTTPADIFHIRRDSTGDSGLIIQNRSGSGTPESGVRFISGAFDLSDNRYAEISSLGGSSPVLMFKTGTAATPSERMRITSAGRIGIGTTAPDKKVEINLGTTDALRLTYNDADGSATTYMDTTLASDGGITFTGAGSSPDFTFAQDVLVPDEVYGVGWNGSLEVPTKNAIYDKIEALGGGSSNSRSVTQASHGFVVGDWLYLNSTTYTKSIATSAAAAEAVGVVTAVADVNTFTLTTDGYVTGLSGLTAGSSYFISPSSAGAMTATEPTTVGQVSKPVFVADTTTTGYVINMRGMLITTAGPDYITWSEVTGTSQTAAVNSGYIANNAGLVTITLPTTAAVGDRLQVIGKGAGGWKIAQNASEIIYFGSSTTTTGTGGSLASTNRRDSVTLVCTTADTEWTVASVIGTLTVV